MPSLSNPHEPSDEIEASRGKSVKPHNTKIEYGLAVNTAVSPRLLSDIWVFRFGDLFRC